jgi:hypothetical protein
VRPHGKYAKVDPNNPEAFAQCDRCGFWRNRTDLVWQVDWAGTHLYNKQILVCTDRCFDKPQEQLRTIILPPDPPPVVNARVPDFAYEEQIVLIAQQGSPTPEPPWAAGPQLILCDQSGTVPLLAQYLNDV